jgi:hypothetical protein
VTDEEIDAFLDSDEPSGPSDEELDAFLDAEETSVAESAYRGAVQGGSLTFGDEIAAGFGAGAYGVAKGVRAVLPGGVPEDAPEVVEVYRTLREKFQAENEEARAANPIPYGVGEVGGVLATSGVNPVSVVRAGGRSLLSLGTREAYTAAAGRALLKQGAKGAGVGAGYGAATAAGSSDADLTQGQYGEFFTDVLEGAESGAKVGAVAGGLLGAGSSAQGQRTARAAKDAATAKAVEEFDAATASLPERRAAVKAENAAATEAATAENIKLKEQFRTDTAAAKAEAKAATKAKQTAAQEAQRAETLSNPLLRTGLEGKQSTLRGPKRARARAQALVDEPVPGDPSKKLIDEAEKLSPEQRLEMATALRQQTGTQLGAIRDELARTDTKFPAAPILAELRGAFGELPAEVQGRALEALKAQVGVLVKDGSLTPASLRKLITDSEALAKYSTPSLEAALGNARGRVYQTAREVFVTNEKAAIATKLPEERAAEYTEALRKYGVYSDFELGSDVLFRRVNRGQPGVRIPKASKVEPVAPREVPKPQPREPMIKAEPAAPEFPGGEEALAAGRRLLQPPRGLAAAGRALGGELGARLGSMVPAPGAAYAGARLGEGIANRWARWMTPTAGSLSTKAKKLERLQPMMEEAMRKGPQEVARVHALFMQRSPDYRKAIESGE